MVLRNRMFEWNTLCTLRELSKLLIKCKKAKCVLWPEFFFILMITLCWAIHPANVVVVKAGHAGSDHNATMYWKSTEGNWIMLLVLAPIFVLVEGHGRNIPWNPISLPSISVVGIKYTREWGQSSGSSWLTSCMMFLSWMMHCFLLDLTEQLTAMLDTLPPVNVSFCVCN